MFPQMQKDREDAMKLGWMGGAIVVLALAGCGSEIARIEGLPQTRDVSGDAWPRLVDVPEPPVGTLAPARGGIVLDALKTTQAQALTRQQQPGAQPVARADLQQRVARLQNQAATVPVSIDQDGLSQRVARLNARRDGSPGGTTDTATLIARRDQLSLIRERAYSEGALPDLIARSERARQRTLAPGMPVDLMPSDRRGDAAPAPLPRPQGRKIDRDAPVISEAFRKRAEEARRQALATAKQEN